MMREHTIRNIQPLQPAESAAELHNPDCGLYRLYVYWPGRGYQELATQITADEDVRLELLEICLSACRDRPMRSAELQELDEFLEAVSGEACRQKHYILRFAYDVSGTAVLTEPRSLSRILSHMEQLGPILIKHAESIYTLQGLFLGNWGEFNGSRFQDAADYRLLAEKLRQVTEGRIRLAVRTPAQWRMIMRSSVTEENAVSCGIGIYNDGMTGSVTDYGTYASDPTGKYESRQDRQIQPWQESDFPLASAWPRDPELAFMNRLCRSQPGGGEVIRTNSWNDLPQALRSLRRMRVTYLNRDYDGAVWEKWKQTEVKEPGAFYGMDGASYIRRHLGYRYVLKRTRLSYQYWQNRIYVSCEFQNAGFAPAYEAIRAEVLLVKGYRILRRVWLQGSLQSLAGGTEREKRLSLSGNVPADGLHGGTLDLLLRPAGADGSGRELGNIHFSVPGEKSQAGNLPGEETGKELAESYPIGRIETVR